MPRGRLISHFTLEAGHDLSRERAFLTAGVRFQPPFEIERYPNRDRGVLGHVCRMPQYACGGNRLRGTGPREGIATEPATGSARSGREFRVVALGMHQHSLDVLTGHAGKPLEEIVDARPVLEILE